MVLVKYCLFIAVMSFLTYKAQSSSLEELLQSVADLEDLGKAESSSEEEIDLKKYFKYVAKKHRNMLVKQHRQQMDQEGKKQEKYFDDILNSLKKFSRRADRRRRA